MKHVCIHMHSCNHAYKNEHTIKHMYLLVCAFFYAFCCLHWYEHTPFCYQEKACGYGSQRRNITCERHDGTVMGDGLCPDDLRAQIKVGSIANPRVLHGPGLGPWAGPARNPWAGPGQDSMIFCGPGRLRARNLQARARPRLVSNNFAGCGPGPNFPGLSRAWAGPGPTGKVTLILT